MKVRGGLVWKNGDEKKTSRNLDSPVVGSSCCPGQLPEDCQHQNALDDYLGMAKRLPFPSSKAFHSSGREDILENRCASISNHCSIDGNNRRAGIFFFESSRCPIELLKEQRPFGAYQKGTQTQSLPLSHPPNEKGRRKRGRASTAQKRMSLNNEEKEGTKERSKRTIEMQARHSLSWISSKTFPFHFDDKKTH